MATGSQLSPSSVVRNVAGNVRQKIFQVTGSGDNHISTGMNARFGRAESLDSADNEVGITMNSTTIGATSGVDPGTESGYVAVDGMGAAEYIVEVIGK